MSKRALFYPLSLAGLLFLGCSDAKQAPLSDAPKGYFTADRSEKALTHPIAMDDNATDVWMLGKSFFYIPWVEAPSATTARDGLGPLFSANTCSTCHPHNGAGAVVNAQGAVERALVFRLSQPSKTPGEAQRSIGFVPDPVYGGQLSVHGNAKVAAEGVAQVRYEMIEGRYGDATHYELQRPVYSVDALGYGALDPQTNIAAHRAIALVGSGLIERIAEADILAYADPDDRNKDGISGRPNHVWVDGARLLGRFTWKAASPSLLHQSANAAHNDMGLSNPLFPFENCTPAQLTCNEAPKGRHEFDLPQERLEAIAFYLSHLKAPLPKVFAKAEEARALMDDLACTRCHVRVFTTQDGVAIEPYSDFLLHDMGEGLADGHRVFEASEREFRTPPLWGVGLHVTGLLHDGRARSIEEAIVWHGGEASSSRDAFKALEGSKRRLLLDYLESL
ncbi:MAG: thiol oxidoreductase [Campylobacterales bacterium]|nr:thiol oxidoreductase [Campylobacterales bacterium]